MKDALVFLDKLSRQTGDASLQRELVEAYVKIGNVQGNSYYSNLGDTAGALASARKAVAAGERLVARDAGGPNQRALAAAYSSEADILYSISDLVGADENYRKAVSLAEAAVRKLPPDLDTRRQLAGTLRNWGDLAGAEGISNMGKPEEALARYRRSLNIVNGLVQEYPGSPLAKRDLYEKSAGAGGRRNDRRPSRRRGGTSSRGIGDDSGNLRRGSRKHERQGWRRQHVHPPGAGSGGQWQCEGSCAAGLGGGIHHGSASEFRPGQSAVPPQPCGYGTAHGQCPAQVGRSGGSAASCAEGAGAEPAAQRRGIRGTWRFYPMWPTAI